MERRRKYRLFLYIVLICSLTALFICWLLLIWEKVPSLIHIRAGVTQELNLNVPISGEITRSGDRTSSQDEQAAVPASGMGEAVCVQSLSVDLREPCYFYAKETDSYSMELKLFGLIPFKTVQVEVISDRKLIPAGFPVGIYVKTQGVLVIDTGEFEGEDGRIRQPAGKVLQRGDYILEADGDPVGSKARFMDLIRESEGKKMVLTILRENQQFVVSLQPERNRNGEYKLGIWIRDNAQGIGTLTYLEPDGSFGALGHGINDSDTAELMSLEKGSLYKTEIVAITKGENGTPGELTGVIDYKQKNRLGEIDANTSVGIFGTLSEDTAGQLLPAGAQTLPIGLKQEIRKGDAQILCAVDGMPQLYDIVITDIRLNHDNVNRGLEIMVQDEGLLDLTGGIVQGMSGSPIIQDGKLVGAVTHVLVNDPTRGYGIFIENMLDAAR